MSSPTDLRPHRREDSRNCCGCPDGLNAGADGRPPFHWAPDALCRMARSANVSAPE